MLSKRYHFLFFDATDPDFDFFISRNSLTYEFLREVHLLLHTDTEKEKQLLILFNIFNIYNAVITYLIIMNLYRLFKLQTKFQLQQLSQFRTIINNRDY